MNVQQNECDRRALERLLADRLGDAEVAALEAHLVDCPACRRHLDDLAADDSLWEDARDLLSDGEATAAEAEPEPDSRALAGLRAYLTPTDDPRYLGRLGAYGVVGLIGCGGFGVVLKAFDAALNRYVAVKALSPQLAQSGAARQRFAREARAAAAVVHDHVVAIYAVAEADGLPYFVMPYINGPSLERRLSRNGPLAVVEVLRIGMQIASGLAAAHAQGLVHRDIKPANVLLEDGAERVTITDFGLARAADDASLTNSGVIAGTPPYMSPEQANGLAVDHHSDLFSLGSVMYAMCTGRPPFRADTTLAVLRRVEECRPRPIREVNPEIPTWLAGVVRKLHAKNPSDRFRSAAEVATLLEQCLAHVQRPTGHPLPPAAAALGRPPAGNWSRRRRLTAAAVALAVAIALAFSLRPAPQDRSGPRPPARPEWKAPAAPVDDAGLAQLQLRRAESLSPQRSSQTDPFAIDRFGQVIAGLRQRLEALRRTVDCDTDSSADPFAAEVGVVRRRLDALGQGAARSE